MPVLKIVALVLPLSMDTFAVSAALGVAGLSPRRRIRLSLVMAAFEAGMPIAGFLIGGLLSGVIGDFTDYAAAALLIAVGLLMLRDGDDEQARLAGTGGWATLAIGLSVSLDELAIGFAMGLLRLPAPILLALIATQALVASQLGMLIGGRVERLVGGHAERAAAFLLITLGAGILVLTLTGHGVG